MDNNEIKKVTDNSLCNTYNFRGFWSGKNVSVVVNEVNRRGLECKPDCSPKGNRFILSSSDCDKYRVLVKFN